MIAFRNLFNRTHSVVIGMVHLRALPGTPQHKLSMNDITEIACHEAEIYHKAKVDGIMVENMHDVPWQRPEDLGPETVSAMSVVCSALRREFPATPMGVQVLTAGNRQALAIAKSCGLNFIRAEGFVFSHIGDEGPIEACAPDILRYRRQIGAEDVLVFTDIKKKHSSHALTADVSLVDTALAAEMFLSDGVIVTGEATARPADPIKLRDVQQAIQIPTIVGSGVTTDNVSHYISANAIIIGSHLKMYGQWHNDLDSAHVKQFMNKVQKHREDDSDMESDKDQREPVKPSKKQTSGGKQGDEDEESFQPLTTQGE